MALPYDDIGRGPAVILLHAGVADRTMWSEHLGPLAEAGYRVIAVDLPGFGEAPAGTGEKGEWVAVLETMDGLSLERAAIAGNSFGGAVALRMALVAPERIAALALFSAPPPALEPSPELAAVWDAEEAALEEGDVEAAVESVIDAWTLPDAPQELRDRVAGMQRRALELQAESSADEVPDPLDERPELLAGLDTPTLLAAGEHDISDFRQGAEAMAKSIPGSRLAIIEGAGHLAPLEVPARFRELLLGHLRGTPGLE